MNDISKRARSISDRRIAILSTACLFVFVSPQVHAQDEASDEFAVRDIVVTAQKREQSLQDVPIAVTALDTTALQANRVVSVMDLSALVPNMSVVTTQGGVGAPTFGMRGVVSQGQQAGQDRSVGMYLDGVYVGSNDGIGFDLPELERIEVLRGPQGTLFGRNSTAGAINIITRDPSGELGLRQQVTLGNYDQLRSSTSVDLPAWGALSALVNYTHDERRGDIRNLGAGMVWDRSVAGLGRQVSPKWLGSKNAESVFAAVKFEPGDRLRLVYKFDWTENTYSPGGTGLVAFTSTNAAVINAYNANPAPLATAKRPKAVNNNYTVPSYLTAHGHNVTATLDLTDNVTLKNVFGYRKSYVVGAATRSGIGGLFVNGNPFLVQELNIQNRHKQWSDEFQVNYDSDLVTMMAGAIYYWSDAFEGPTRNLLRSYIRQAIPGGVFAASPLDGNFVKSKAIAGYVQAEAHITPQLDVVGGYRLTNDKKQGTNYIVGRAFTFDYNDTKPSYLVGVNYKPTDDILVFAKYSTGFVAGGMIADITFKPETAKSLEAGLKADLFDRRLRFNLALFHAKYRNMQALSSGFQINRPELGTVIISQGNLKVQGFEVELTAAPIDGLTVGGSFGYTDHKLTNLNPLFCLAPCTAYRRPFFADSTGNLSVEYQSRDVFGSAGLAARIDANWRSKIVQISRVPLIAGHGPIEYSPAGWIVNGRLAFRDIALAGGSAEIAAWVRNLLDNDRPNWVGSSSDFAAADYEAARTFGIDIKIEY